MKRAIPIPVWFLDIGGVLLIDGCGHNARKRSGLALPQIDAAFGVLEYKTVGKAMQRFEVSVLEDRQNIDSPAAVSDTSRLLR